MASSPRIFRAPPQGPVTRTERPIDVVATVRWSTGEVTAVPATAIAWTRREVQIAWTPPGGTTRTDWISAGDVRRAGGPPLSRPGASSAEPPRSTTRRRPRW